MSDIFTAEPFSTGREAPLSRHVQAAVDAASLLRFAPAGFTAPLRAFQFPSIGHLDERVQHVLTRAEAVEGVRPSTVQWMRNGYASLRRYLTESEKSEMFVRGDFEQQREILATWCGWLLHRRAGRVTTRTYWRAVAAICRRIEAQDRLASPFNWLAAPRAGRILPKSLTRDEARRVLLFVRNHDWPTPYARARNTAIVATMLLAGLRRSEVVKLRREDIHDGAGAIVVRAGKGRFGGKDRTAYMAPQFEPILNDYCVVRASRKTMHPALFVGIYRDIPVTSEAIKRLFETITARVGFRVSPHRLRQTFATLLRQAGVADRVSMDLLGHEHLTTLQRTHAFSTVNTGRRFKSSFSTCRDRLAAPRTARPRCVAAYLR